MGTRIYLDNNATTPIHPEVLSFLNEVLRDVYGNASSVHKEGQSSRRLIENARESVARLMGASAREIVFTSGGTESNNAAIAGVMRGSERHHIVTTAIEHDSVHETVKQWDATMVSPGRNGRVDAEAVIAAIEPKTALVTVMLANNETGVIQPVAEIARVCRERHIHFHCDAVQGAGKIDLQVEALGVDSMSISAHKLHAPKGVGALFIRRDVKLNPLILGGAQERRRRAGTENVPMAAAFGLAAEKAVESSCRGQIGVLRDRLESSLTQPHHINGAEVPRVPNTSSVTFSEADAEGIVIALDLEGVAISTGSACSSGRVEPSRALLAMGLTNSEARATVRMSLSRFNTEEEIDRVGMLLERIVPLSREKQR